jgi:mannose-6-phosphate isomerase-like protein (cupin superfamily)
VSDEGMASRGVVVRPGEGKLVGNVEFLARSDDTPRFNFAVITIQPYADGPGEHAHHEEDDSFYMLEGELVFVVDGEDIVAGPGSSSSSHPTSPTPSTTAAIRSRAS